MEEKNITRSAGLVGLWIAVSRVLGMARDMAMAAVFGSSAAMDAFVVAFTIPNLFRGLFGEGALSSAFVPVFTETLTREPRQEVWRFAQRMFSLLAFTLLLLTLIGIVAAGASRYILPPTPRLELIARLSVIMLPYMFFICLTAFFSAILNALQRFGLPAAIPLILNMIMLAALFLIYLLFPAGDPKRIYIVAWSVLLAGLLQAAAPLPALLRHGWRPVVDVNWRDPRVRRVLSLMGAAAIGVGVSQFNVLLDRFIAVWIGEGAPSFLYYAERLVYLPLGIFGTAMGTVLLPTLAIHSAQAQSERVRATLHYAMRQIIFITLPAAAGMLVLAGPIVKVIYEHGDFTPEATRMTALALACYAPGLVVFSLVKVLVPVFYARKDMRTPVKVGVMCSALNLVLSLLLMWPLRHAGIAVATVLASGAQVAGLSAMLRRYAAAPDWLAIAKSVARLAVPLGVMMLAAWYAYYFCAAHLAHAGLANKAAAVLALAAAVASGAVVYLATAFACRCREAQECVRALRRHTQ